VGERFGCRKQAVVSCGGGAGATGLVEGREGLRGCSGVPSDWRDGGAEESE
jgi:hypothetical protein